MSPCHHYNECTYTCKDILPWEMEVSVEFQGWKSGQLRAEPYSKGSGRVRQEKKE